MQFLWFVCQLIQSFCTCNTCMSNKEWPWRCCVLFCCGDIVTSGCIHVIHQVTRSNDLRACNTIILLPLFVTVTSQWARCCLESPASPVFTQPFIQAQIKENINAPRHWPLCGEFTGDRWFPAQMASNAVNASIWWRHHFFLCSDITTWTI